MIRLFKYILIFLCFASICFARGDYYKGAETVSSESCGSGSPPLLFKWDATSTTITDGAGCSQGDTIAALTGEGTITGGAVSITDGSSNGADYYALATDTYDIFPQGDFTIQFKLYITSAADRAMVFQEYPSADSKTVVYLENDGNEDITLHRRVDGVDVISYHRFDISTILGGTGWSVDTWYYIVIRSSTTDGPDLWISTTKWPDVDTGGGWIEDSDTLTAYTDTTGAMRYGNASANAAVFKLDEMKVYGGWKTY